MHTNSVFKKLHHLALVLYDTIPELTIYDKQVNNKIKVLKVEMTQTMFTVE